MTGPRVFGRDARPDATWRVQENPDPSGRRRWPISLYLGNNQALDLSPGAAADLLAALTDACKTYPAPDRQGAPNGRSRS